MFKIQRIFFLSKGDLDVGYVIKMLTHSSNKKKCSKIGTYTIYYIFKLF